MCAQFTLKVKLKDLINSISCELKKDFDFNDHIFPSMVTPAVVISRTGKPVLIPMEFGLVREVTIKNREGHWIKRNRRFHNARIETILDKPSFRNAYASKRCVVPLTSFFEFVTNEINQKERIEINHPNHSVIWAAGIFDSHHDNGKLSRSCAIVTTEAGEKVKAAGHERSPLILPLSSVREWLSVQRTPDITHMVQNSLSTELIKIN